jgi:hypothetical protein
MTFLLTKNEGATRKKIISEKNLTRARAVSWKFEEISNSFQKVK